MKIFEEKKNTIPLPSSLLAILLFFLIGFSSYYCISSGECWGDGIGLSSFILPIYYYYYY